MAKPYDVTAALNWESCDIWRRVSVRLTAPQWDVLLEGRALWLPLADDMRIGALGAIYRHIGNNVKVGVGYSLSDFSDNLTDQSYSSHGPFLNLLSKF